MTFPADDLDESNARQIEKPPFAIDREKVAARVAEYEAEAVSHEQTADRLDVWADQERREAHRLRGQNLRLLAFATERGYADPAADAAHA